MPLEANSAVSTHPLSLRVDEGDVGGGAGGPGGVTLQPLTQDAGWPNGKPVYQQKEVDGSSVYQIHEGSQGCFQHGDAELSILVGAHLGSEVVGGMVGGDAVDGAVHEAFQQSFCVVRLPKGGG